MHHKRLKNSSKVSLRMVLKCVKAWLPIECRGIMSLSLSGEAAAGKQEQRAIYKKGTTGYIAEPKNWKRWGVIHNMVCRSLVA